MKNDAPCCSVVQADPRDPWSVVGREAALAPSTPIPPPQLMEGLCTLMDLGTIPHGDIGRVHTFVDPVTSTWTEHWAVQPTGWFGDSTRRTRVQRTSSQTPPWSAVSANYAGWWHAAMVYQYVAPPKPNAAPQLPAGTFVFDVRNTPTGPLRGLLFRSPGGGSTFRDRWLLFSTYVKPQGTTSAELAPRTGNAQTLLVDALTQHGTGAEWVDVTYTVAKLP